jgi:hypothetical protein
MIVYLRIEDHGETTYYELVHQKELETEQFNTYIIEELLRDIEKDDGIDFELLGEKPLGKAILSYSCLKEYLCKKILGLS